MAESTSQTAGVEESALDVAADLSAFQVHILAILAEESRYGLAVKSELEAFYGEEVNHGRLYPNLDELAERGLVEIGELDKRTNEYRLSDRGAEVLAAYQGWLLELAGDDDAGLRERVVNAVTPD